MLMWRRLNNAIPGDRRERESDEEVIRAFARQYDVCERNIHLSSFSCFLFLFFFCPNVNTPCNSATSFSVGRFVTP